MAGMSGFEHTCDTGKVNISQFKRTIHCSGLNFDEVSIIWDFYVAHSFASACGQAITLEEYGWANTVSKVNGLPKLEEELMSSSGVEKLCCIRSTSIKDTLSACDLSGTVICVEHPRIVLQQLYELNYNENEEIHVSSKESRIIALFRHIRNALAHGNTYFFENGMVLLEDKESSKITAKILIKKQTLLDWIYIIDKNERFYRRPTSEEVVGSEMEENAN